ncbi:MAG TPA: EAL domain-containing protein [Rickettsiales bacterium]|nr:EAL domain-containing protein [Rickettsiales bacterium]
MNADKIPFTFNLPYNQSSTYWLAVYPPENMPEFRQSLTDNGLAGLPGGDGACVMKISGTWADAWKNVKESILQHNVKDGVQVSLLTGENQPEPQEFSYTRKSFDILDKIASSLWLGEAMLEDRIVCYMQPVFDKRNKVFGHEAFARIETADKPVGGGQIIEASKYLNAEYMLDRYLHLKAIRTFISSDLEGFLFINLIPGFIHRPEKYLEGLSESAKFNGMPSKQIVLDFTQSETPRDMSHLKSIFDYCRSHGYLLSMDDIASVAMAKKILETVRPDFIKLDVHLVRSALEAQSQRTIAELVSMAHSSGATIIAEGVETEETHAELLKAGVDLFQGYLFSPPVAVSRLKNIVG